MYDDHRIISTNDLLFVDIIPWLSMIMNVSLDNNQHIILIWFLKIYFHSWQGLKKNVILSGETMKEMQKQAKQTKDVRRMTVSIS